jgi:hypothetical protein
MGLMTKKQRAGPEARPLRRKYEKKGLDGRFVAFVCPNPVGFAYRQDEDFAVADLAGFRGFQDGFDNGIDFVVAGDDFDFHLGKNIDGVFAAAVDFLVALLAAKALSTPAWVKASLTSSNLNGWMMASIFFIGFQIFLGSAARRFSSDAPPVSIVP